MNRLRLSLRGKSVYVIAALVMLAGLWWIASTPGDDDPSSPTYTIGGQR